MENNNTDHYKPNLDRVVSLETFIKMASMSEKTEDEFIKYMNRMKEKYELNYPLLLREIISFYEKFLISQRYARYDGHLRQDVILKKGVSNWNSLF